MNVLRLAAIDPVGIHQGRPDAATAVEMAARAVESLVQLLPLAYRIRIVFVRSGPVVGAGLRFAGFERWLPTRTQRVHFNAAVRRCCPSAGRTEAARLALARGRCTQDGDGENGPETSHFAALTCSSGSGTP